MRAFQSQNLILLLIVLFAATFRVSFVAWDWVRHPAQIGMEADNIAISLLAGKGFSSPFGVPSGPSAWLTPVYPFIVVEIFKLFGPNSNLSHVVKVALNELFSALTCIPIFLIGKRMGGRRLAVAASLLWAIFPIAGMVSLIALWYTSLSAFLMAWTIWATMAVLRSHRCRDWIGYGLLWGLGIMTNASVFSVLPFFLAWLILVRYRSHLLLSSAWMPFIALATIAVSCAPWTVRNYIAFGKLVPFRSNFGAELWYYNVPVAKHPSLVISERDLFGQMGERAYTQDRGDRAIGWILTVAQTNPRGLLRNIGNHFVGMWIGDDHPLNDISKNGFYSAVDLLLCSLALAGLVLLCRNSPEYFWLFMSAPFAFPLVYYLTTASDIYRHPIDPLLIVLSGYFLSYLLPSPTQSALVAGSENKARESTTEETSVLACSSNGG
jgi:4-amino-4-deoxy-L-arabinose transferase-like glycosyltransferase